MKNTFRPVVLIPSFNSGDRLKPTVLAALKVFTPLRVVIDGSTDGSDQTIDDLSEQFPDFEIIRIPQNGGKGAAIKYTLNHLQKDNYTHVLTMDADGQHPANAIPDLLKAAEAYPHSIVMGNPIFGDDVPKARLKGRKITIWWTDLETLWSGLGDTLFGMRVYPLKGLQNAFRQTSFARGFDFDPEVAVRIAWQGYKPVQVPVPVKYFKASEGGISHFNYLRDNILLTWLHFRLIPEFLILRIWPMLKYKFFPTRNDH